MCTNTSGEFQSRLRPQILQPWGTEKSGDARIRRIDNDTNLLLVLKEEADESSDKERQCETDEDEDDIDVILESPCERRATINSSAKFRLVDIIGQCGYQNRNSRHHHNLMQSEHQLLQLFRVSYRSDSQRFGKQDSVSAHYTARQAGEPQRVDLNSSRIRLEGGRLGGVLQFMEDSQEQILLQSFPSLDEKR